jgi:hypothetical protein
VSQAQIFLNLFNQLEQHLDGLNDSTEHYGFRRLVDSLSKTNEIIGAYKYDLIEFLELRNAIVHKSTGAPIAEPDPQIVLQLEKILNELQHPLTAIDIAAEPVFTCQTTTKIVDVLETMTSKFYTSVPVYDNKKFVGVFSDRSIVEWLTTQARQGTISLADKTLAMIQPFLHDKDDKYHSYRFVAKSTSAHEVRESFTSFIS